ncbi:MAG: hypothetical protein HOQ05_00220 [Corynebacteriales bacterium]|nr:hypothetical protein [Mycobacteriales bacterium]
MGFLKLLKGIGQVVMAATSGASASRALMAGASTLPLNTTEPLERTNHRGETVSLISGPVLTLAATTAAAGSTGNKRLAAASAIAGLSSGAVGFYDDIIGARPEQKRDKGFAGHLNALKEGRVSAGLVKVVGIGAAGLAAGAVLHPRKPVDALLAGGIIAGTANLLNLLDLRPGRAIKASMIIGAPLLGGPARSVAATTMGAAGALLPEDLAERTMLGDSGANALGALLGVSIAAHSGRKSKVAVLAGLVALTAASEKISFTKVIEATPVLREIDMYGRRPPAPVVPEPANAESTSGRP